MEGRALRQTPLSIRELRRPGGGYEAGKRIKVYALTAQGRAQLRAESAQWAHFTAAVAKVLSPA